MKPQHQNICNIKNQDGFTFLEVMISMVIITTGILAVTLLQTSSIGGNSTANRLSTATTWATDQTEQYIAQTDYTQVVSGVTNTQDNYVVTTTVTAGTPLTNTSTVAVVVTKADRTGQGGQRSITLSYIKADLSQYP